MMLDICYFVQRFSPPHFRRSVRVTFCSVLHIFLLFHCSPFGKSLFVSEREPFLFLSSNVSLDHFLDRLFSPIFPRSLHRSPLCLTRPCVPLSHTHKVHVHMGAEPLHRSAPFQFAAPPPVADLIPQPWPTHSQTGSNSRRIAFGCPAPLHPARWPPRRPRFGCRSRRPPCNYHFCRRRRRSFP